MAGALEGLNQPAARFLPSTSQKPLARPQKLSHALLLALWVYSYSALIHVFRALKRLESR